MRAWLLLLILGRIGIKAITTTRIEEFNATGAGGLGTFTSNVPKHAQERTDNNNNNQFLEVEVESESGDFYTTRTYAANQAMHTQRTTASMRHAG